MCSTNHIFLEWSVSTFRQHETRSIPYLDPNPTIAPILLNSANFILARVSSQRALPLVSNMTIMNVTSNLEGTVITCTGRNSSSVSSVEMMSTIHIYDMDVGRSLIQMVFIITKFMIIILFVYCKYIDIPNPPEITVRPDMTHLGADNFTVTLEWSQFSGETYSIASIPEPVLVCTSFATSTSV
jgi:hypothetical protein